MIESISTANIDDVLPLIRAYQEFYDVADISDEKNKQFFSQFGESSRLGCQFAFRDGIRFTGFATVYFSFSSTITEKVAVLNDVYVTPSARRRGIATILLDHCQQFASMKGAVRLQWLTARDNEAAQSLYDSLNTSKSDWCFYTLPVKNKLL